MPESPQLLNPQEGIAAFLFELFARDHVAWKQHVARALQVLPKGPEDYHFQHLAVESRGLGVKGKVNLLQ